MLFTTLLTTFLASTSAVFGHAIEKRQVGGFPAPVTTQELIKMCPLNNVQSSDVVAGCISGIWNSFCKNPYDKILLGQCHDAYNRAFGASIFKSLGNVCPAWKSGPRSLSCSTAISTFSYNYEIGKDAAGNPIYMRLNASHAQQLVSQVFASQTFAPCVAPYTCYW